MNALNVSRGAPRPIRSDTTAHLYAVGQTVRLSGGFIRGSHTASIHRVTGRLPSTGEFPQYRIRNDDERYERVTTENNLEPVNASPGKGADLLEATFGHG